MSDARMVKLATLWQRRSAKGATYFSGYLGACQLLMFDEGEQDHPTRPGEKVHAWKLLVQERDPTRRPPAKQDDDPLPYRGQWVWDRARAAGHER